MGQLLFYDKIQPRANWYFPDAYYGEISGGQRGWVFKWPSTEFPISVAIHEDEVGVEKPSIRKWIERNDVGTVIYDFIDNSYRSWYSDSREWEKTFIINNKWIVFYFEDSESALAFSLRFSDLVRQITDDHPTKHYGTRYHY